MWIKIIDTYIWRSNKLCHTALRSDEGALKINVLALALTGGPQRAVGLFALPGPTAKRNSFAIKNDKFIMFSVARKKIHQI